MKEEYFSFGGYFQCFNKWNDADTAIVTYIILIMVMLMRIIHHGVKLLDHNVVFPKQNEVLLEHNEVFPERNGVLLEQNARWDKQKHKDKVGFCMN